MKNIIIFGTGEIGKIAISCLKSEYNVKAVVDNDNGKWGRAVDGYIIQSPEIIRNYDCMIAVASTNYCMEIMNQLQDMGIEHSNIFLCRRYMKEGQYGCDIYPSDVQKLKGTEKSLIEFDLLNRTESICGKLKVMVFCLSYSVYTKQLIENMSKRYNDIEFSLITSAAEYEENLFPSEVRHIYCFSTMADLKAILEKLPIYDAMQFLWIETFWAYFYELIRDKTRRLNLNVGGSDFYRASSAERDYKKKLVAVADQVTAENVETVQKFKEYYIKEAGSKMGLLPFGIEVLDYIQLLRKENKNELKGKYGIPLNKIVVTCAHSAARANRHLELTDALSRLSNNIKKTIVCVFPMTYPSNVPEYVKEVDDKLKESGLDYIILTKFMDFHEMAEYAVISDIMIRVQTTDQLSSMMLEAMYAGGIVVAGSWLPYQSLRKMGISFWDVDTISDVPNILEDVVANIDAYKEKCKGNEELVRRHSSWDVLAPKWHALWE